MLTVIPEEMDAVLDRLGATVEAGLTGAFTSPVALARRGLDALPFVVARCYERSNEPASRSATNLMEDWRPETIILTGIAGGIRRVVGPIDERRLDDGPDLGDVVVAEMIHFGDYGKDVPGGFLPRWLPLVHPPTTLVRRHTEALRISGDWANGLASHRPDGGHPKLVTGELIAVEAVAGNPYADRQQHLLEYFDKAIAVDMESKGVARALHDYESDVGVHYHPRWLCVRGISDLVVGGDEAAALLAGDNNEQREMWKNYAAMAAAEVTRLIVARLVAQDRPRHEEQPAVAKWA
ncbi:hypothetical protein ACNKF0_00160 [Nocardioides sp. T5]|uniref:5'-methylthioadenosine/S-adenosylhomocysteine nucleosidase family protein n=1 Tax=Nocardioides sp. T5 TaxID=3400182 RepID=UPI003A869CA5